MSFGIETLCLDRFCSIRIEFDVTELDNTVCCDIKAGCLDVEKYDWPRK